jgi:hypothetical protein
MAYTTIDNPELYFQTKLYTGDGSSRSITLDGSEDMQPDWVWIKDKGRSGYNHILNDSVRGATKYVRSNLTNDEDTYTNAITSFDSNGFTLGADSSNGEHNVSSQSYVAWCWKESPTAGFDILTFTGNASGNQTISHNLSAVPKWWNIKRLDQASNWCTYHVGLGGADHNLFLNTTSASQTDTGIWNNTLPTSSVFSVGNNIDANGNGASHIYYGWAEKQGYSKFGSYTGNGNADGTFIYTGFRPAWIIIKRSSSSGSNWHMHDTKRDPFNIVSADLYADANNAEDDSTDRLDIVSNGIKIRNSNGAYNTSGATYIYAAFAESPFVNSNGVPTNAR